MMSPHILEAVRVRLQRQSAEAVKTVLEGESLTLDPGESVQIRGPSGSGKSSLLWALARMLPIEDGKLFLEGRPAAEWSVPAWRNRAALVLQEHALVPGTVRDNIALPWKFKVRRGGHGGSAAPPPGPPDDELARTEMDRIGLADVSLSADVSKLSVGQSARVSLIRTLLTAPACLLLDEPLAALDPETAKLVMDRIGSFTKTGGAALIVSHNRTFPGEGRVLSLEKGKIEEAAS